MDYNRTQPCNNCPYRKDAPLKHWSVEEFKDLIRNDKLQLGTNYGCHKKDGHVCVGWLMDQDKRDFPSIILRVSLSKNKVTREYLDKLNCKSSLFKSIKEMAKANYPEEF
jgi:hypothetical protein